MESGINSNWNRKDPALGQETRLLIVLIEDLYFAIFKRRSN